MPEKNKAVTRTVAKLKKKPIAKPVSKAVSKKPVVKAVAKVMVKPVVKKAPTPVLVEKKSPPAVKVKPEIKCPFGQKDLERFKKLLFDLRARLTGQVSALASESLTVADETPAEDRTDDFDREFALNVAGTVQDALFEIDEALRRIMDGRYGICEISGKAIEKERLKALPYARYCVAIQADMEKGRTRYRPFGNAIIQPPEREPNAAESEEQE